MADPIQLLMQDHREVEQLFDKYEKDHDPGVLRKICTELTVHTAVEEKVIYPALGSQVDGGRGLREHAEEEHDEVKAAIIQIERLGYDNPEVRQYVQEIVAGVTEHVQEEERDILPRLTAELTAERLATLGEEAEQLKTELTAQAKTAGPLIDLTKEQLYELAQEKGIEHRSEMSKDDLIAALRES